MARDEKRDPSDLDDLAAGLTDDGAPVDLAAVRRDDALIEAISSGGPVTTDSTEQYELALILSKWRDDVVSTPMPEGPLLEDVIAAIESAPPSIADRERSRSRLRLVRPIAAAAAVAAVVFGGGSMLAYDAQPGDALWGVKQVVFADEANSTVAKIDTTSELEKAERLLAAGDIPEAKKVLDNAAQRAGDVKDSQEKTDLVERWGKLMTQAQETGAPIAPPLPSTTGGQSSLPATSVTSIPAQPSTSSNVEMPGTGPVTSTSNAELPPPSSTNPSPSTSAPTSTSAPSSSTTTPSSKTTTTSPNVNTPS
ncbi:anti-sigma-D factor RsdA [Rhodococcus sp. IEGM 1379]|uniref:anti-sigma-D factor RsdA n=1 Tax=Rhodococcus sp. IEGM 1379 TaxID=3047086 RepID=UPI0024B66F49|nr:anti-sigma-D factor RsdA [Rhodococcus sp. IEGM 1379]MDI9914685.1 anti-sigma-D factor RsdA [Rhodococcus sp. IEGM 1379]